MLITHPKKIFSPTKSLHKACQHTRVSPIPLPFLELIICYHPMPALNWPDTELHHCRLVFLPLLLPDKHSWARPGIIGDSQAFKIIVQGHGNVSINSSPAFFSLHLVLPLWTGTHLRPTLTLQHLGLKSLFTWMTTSRECLGEAGAILGAVFLLLPELILRW